MLTIQQYELIGIFALIAYFYLIISWLEIILTWYFCSSDALDFVSFLTNQIKLILKCVAAVIILLLLLDLNFTLRRYSSRITNF